MHLKFVFGGVEHSVNTIMKFIKDGNTNFWSEPFFHFSPDIEKDRFYSMSDDEKHQFLTGYFSALYEKNKSLLREKLLKYNSYWLKYEAQIVTALQEAFGINLDNVFNDLVCYTSFCPICPRYLDRNCFNNFYLESERGALGTALHEIIHFVWFYVWHENFRDDYIEYETPHLKWILSEMVVEPIMRDDRLGRINPYYADKSCVYFYFYTMKIDGKSILDTLYKMLKSMPMCDFMKAGYKYCVEHEAEIRKHIEDSENTFR